MKKIKIEAILEFPDAPSDELCERVKKWVASAILFARGAKLTDLQVEAVEED